MKKLISFLSILVLLVILSLSYTTAQAENKFKITATSTTNSVKLKWSKAKGAKHYKIYRKTANKKYKLVKKTTKKVFTDKKLKENKKYIYKVKAFKKNKKGKFYSFKSATKTVKTNGATPVTTITQTIVKPTTTTTNETASVSTTQPTQITTSTTQPTVSSTQTTITTTQPITTPTTEPTTVSTTQPTIPQIPTTTVAEDYEILVKEARLKELHQNPDTAHATLDDIRIEDYYGTFNDCIVVMIWDDFTTVNCMMYDVYVEGIKFRYADNRRALVLKDGEFYQLQQAYDNGFLTLEDLQTIANKHNGPMTPPTTTTKSAPLTLGSLPPLFEHTGSLKSYYDGLNNNQLVSLIYKDFDYFIPSDSQLMNIEYSLFWKDKEYDKLKETWGYTAKFKLTKEGYDSLSNYFEEADSWHQAQNYGQNYSWWDFDDSLVTHNNSTIGEGHLIYANNRSDLILTIWNYSWLTSDNGEYYLYLDTPLSDMTCDWYELKNELPELSEHQGSLKSYFDGLNEYQLAQVIKKDFDYFIPSDSQLMDIEYSLYNGLKNYDNLQELWGYSAKFKLTESGYEQLTEYFSGRQNMIEYILYLNPQEQDVNYSWWDVTKEDVIFIDQTSGSTNICFPDYDITIFGNYNYSWLAQIDGEYYLYINTELSHFTSDWYELKNKVT